MGRKSIGAILSHWKRTSAMARSVSARIQILLALSYLRHGELEIAYEQLSRAREDADGAGDGEASKLIATLKPSRNPRCDLPWCEPNVHASITSKMIAGDSG